MYVKLQLVMCTDASCSPRIWGQRRLEIWEISQRCASSLPCQGVSKLKLEIFRFVFDYTQPVCVPSRFPHSSAQTALRLLLDAWQNMPTLCPPKTAWSPDRGVALPLSSLARGAPAGAATTHEVPRNTPGQACPPAGAARVRQGARSQGAGALRTPGVRSAIDSTKCVDTGARSLPVLAWVELRIDAEAKTC